MKTSIPRGFEYDHLDCPVPLRHLDTLHVYQNQPREKPIATPEVISPSESTFLALIKYKLSSETRRTFAKKSPVDF